MSFIPLTMDGQQAAQKMLSWGTYRPHACLAAVHNAFPFARSDSPGSYTSARVQWDRTPQNRRHPGDRGVPPGGLVFFDLAVAGLAGRPGHIGISLGGDRFVSTDWPTRGKIGVATIGEVERKWNATYLGWTDVVGGHNVTVGADPDTVATVPQPASLVGRRINLDQQWFWYGSDVDAAAMRNPHGGRFDGKPMLSGEYVINGVGAGGALYVTSRSVGRVWLHPSAIGRLV